MHNNTYEQYRKLYEVAEFNGTWIATTADEPVHQIVTIIRHKHGLSIRAAKPVCSPERL
jgi:hypothetical protein